MHDHFTDAAGITPRSERRRFNRALDNLLAEVGFSTKKQAILPENSDRMKKAFHDFFDEMDWPLAQWNFSALLEEKKGEHAFRADGKTPNWYHEAREILFFLTHVRTGILKISDLNPYGGPEVGVATIWRHDSWEDLGQNAHSIFSGMDEHIHEIWGKAGHDDAYYFMLRQKAVMISDNVDLLTRKYPRLDEHGAYVRKPTGKYIKDDRFGGDINLYMNQVAKNPLTVMAKYYDGIDGMFTRNNVPVFNDAANRSYNEERRMIYGHRAFDLEAIENFPFLKKAVESADGMLGILLSGMETIINYSKPENDPQNARPIRIGRYLPAATKGFEILPSWCHPIAGFLEDLHDKAANETAPHTHILLEKAFYPPLLPAFCARQDKRAGARHLPESAAYAPNVA